MDIVILVLSLNGVTFLFNHLKAFFTLNICVKSFLVKFLPFLFYSSKLYNIYFWMLNKITKTVKFYLGAWYLAWEEYKLLPYLVRARFFFDS